jgi:N-dimethylarginine dimethylaminohydrolase
MTRIPLNVRDETSRLRAVILGIGTSPGKPRLINAKSREAMAAGIYPKEGALNADLREFAAVLTTAGVTVLRPRNLPNVNQVFTRDIGFVVGQTFVRGGMKVPKRAREYRGIEHLIRKIATTVVTPPRGVTVEGGDVVLFRDLIFVGQGGRTNAAAVPFLRDLFPSHTVVPLKLRYRSSDPLVSVLHLDCVFQPVGLDTVLIFRSGFIEPPGVVNEVFPQNRQIQLGNEDLRNLCCNVFSLSSRHIVSCTGFHRLNRELRDRGFRVTTIPFTKVPILGGLLRCSTLPLLRDAE